MKKDKLEEYYAYILQKFPERQMYLRSNGVVHYYVLAPWMQILAVSGLAFLILWSFINVIGVLSGNNPFKSINQEVRQLKAHYQVKLDEADLNEQNIRRELLQQQENFINYAKTFEEKHGTILELLHKSGFKPNTPPDSISYAQSHVLMSPAVRDVTPRMARRELSQTADLGETIKIDNVLQNILNSQNNFLKRTETQTLKNIEKAYAILEITGVEAKDILDSNSFGIGGIFVAATDDKSSNQNAFLEAEPLSESEPEGLSDGHYTTPRLTNLKIRVAESEALDQALQFIPFGVPVSGNYYKTSLFGKRNDPFTKRPAHHNGVDFGSYRLAPIVATAPGKVKFSGRKNGYGNMIEIDHGYGFITRYAHLEKLYVKRGQTIEKGTKIGAMGSTGRSTSTHLHYEVHFQGYPRDPDKFLKAGYYVQ